MTRYNWIVMLAMVVALLVYREPERFLGCHVGSSLLCSTICRADMSYAEKVKPQDRQRGALPYRLLTLLMTREYRFTIHNWWEARPSMSVMIVIDVSS